MRHTDRGSAATLIGSHPDFEALVQAVVSFADGLVDDAQPSTRWDHITRRWES